MKTKAILAALMLMACSMVSAQTKYMNVKTAEGNTVSFEVTPELQVTWDDSPLAVTPIENALPGKFCVGNNKYVYFSKGNLYYNGSVFQFEDNQYSIAASWNDSHVSNFNWATNPAVACAESYDYEYGTTSASDVLFTNTKGFTVAGQTDVWFTLTKDEWYYLFTNYAYKYVSVCGKFGIVIAPADVKVGDIPATYNNTTWATAESNGFVFLPNTGFRSYDNIQETDKSCIYWSSTAEDDDYEEYFPRAYREFFQWNNSETKLDIDIENTGDRSWGAGIRLVTTKEIQNIYN